MQSSLLLDVERKAGIVVCSSSLASVVIFAVLYKRQINMTVLSDKVDKYSVEVMLDNEK